MAARLYVSLSITAALSMMSGAAISRDGPCLGRVEGGQSVRYSLRIPANSLLCLRTDVFLASLQINLRDPDGNIVAEVHPPPNLYGAYSLAAMPQRAGEYTLEVANGQPSSQWAAYEIRLIELRGRIDSDAHRLDAERLLNRAIDTVGSVPTAEAAAAALHACGKDPDVLCQARASFVTGLLYLHANQYREADRAFGHTLEFQTHNDYLEAAVLNQLLLTKTKLGDFAGAAGVAIKAVAASEKAGSPNLKAIAHSRRAGVHRFLGEDSEVILESEEAIRIAESAGLDFITTETRVRLAEMLMSHGDPRAEEVAKAALATSRAYRLVSLEAYALNTLANIRYRLGDPQSALDYASQATPLYASGLDLIGQAQNLYLLAGIYSGLRPAATINSICGSVILHDRLCFASGSDNR